MTFGCPYPLVSRFSRAVRCQQIHSSHNHQPRIRLREPRDTLPWGASWWPESQCCDWSLWWDSPGRHCTPSQQQDVSLPPTSHMPPTLQTTNSKCHMAYWIKPFAMTLIVTQLLQGLQMEFMGFIEHLCNILHVLNWHSVSRGPWAIAELLVFSSRLKYHRFLFCSHLFVLIFVLVFVPFTKIPKF